MDTASSRHARPIDEWAVRLRGVIEAAERDGYLVSYSDAEGECGCCDSDIISLEIYSPWTYTLREVREVNK
jgi:hypothetical protein